MNDLLTGRPIVGTAHSMTSDEISRQKSRIKFFFFEISAVAVTAIIAVA